jgi:GNAT superfamily N-acetyltransferase/RimJ/RimL family protein N-acetyltransferase
MSELTIRRVDPHDDADMDAFQQVYADAERAEDPDAPLYSREDAVAMLASPGGNYFFDGFGAYLDGVMVGESIVTGERRLDARTARLWVWVDPQRGRRGIGSRLVAHGEDVLRSMGRAVCQAQTRIGSDRHGPNRRFAEGLGYALANTEVERRLSLPADPFLLERLATEAEPYHRDYAIRVVVGPVPSELAASYVALKNRITVEMPSGDLEVEEGQDTVAELAIQDRHLIEAHRTRVSAFALDRTGAVVGYSVAAVSAAFDHVDQWGTLVHPRHRGHRLGMAVKCAGLQAIGESFPGKRHITTQNAETNDHMVAINEEMGFRRVGRWAEWQLEVPPA